MGMKEAVGTRKELILPRQRRSAETGESVLIEAAGPRPRSRRAVRRAAEKRFPRASKEKNPRFGSVHGRGWRRGRRGLSESDRHQTSSPTRDRVRNPKRVADLASRGSTRIPEESQKFVDHLLGKFLRVVVFSAAFFKPRTRAIQDLLNRRPDRWPDASGRPRPLARARELPCGETAERCS